MEMKVIRASDLAKLLTFKPGGSEEGQKFGKIFEECYSFACYLYEELTGYGRKVTRNFLRKCAALMREEGIYSKELVIRAYRMYSCLINCGLTGRKPKTRFRQLNDLILVAAQPDLYNWRTYIEIKTYPLNEYARMQASIFAWVLGEPMVVLVGLHTDETGYVTAEKEKITPLLFEEAIGELEIPQNIGAIQEVCERCRLPFRYCTCMRYEKYYDDWEENDEDAGEEEVFSV